MSDQQPPPGYTGLWTIRRPHGAKIEIEYVNGVPNGVCRHWHEHGACLREGFTKNGQWHGTLVTRGADGLVLDVSEFQEGTGIYRIFNSSNQQTDEVPMRRGKPHGVVRYWRRGKLAVTMYYEDGRCDAAICEA